MSYPNHVADIVRELLIDQLLATDPVDGDDWPAYCQREPNTPDSLMTLYPTDSDQFGKIQITGRDWEEYGLQILIRSKGYDTGYAKAAAIADALKSLRRVTITIGVNEYLIHAFRKITAILPLGTDTPNSKLYRFSMNYQVSITKEE